MQHGARDVVRGSALAALSALLLVLCVSMGAAAPAPAASVTTCAGGVHHSTEDLEPGPSSAVAIPASRAQQSHRIDPPTPALFRELVEMSRLLHSMARPAASELQPHSITRVTRDGRAPPA
jgi:hypothetical protein